MHHTLLQSLFEHSFYVVSDLTFLMLNAYAATIVNRGPWRLHLNWLIPFVFQGLLTLVYRGILSLHYFLCRLQGMLLARTASTAPTP